MAEREDHAPRPETGPPTGPVGGQATHGERVEAASVWARTRYAELLKRLGK